MKRNNAVRFDMTAVVPTRARVPLCIERVEPAIAGRRLEEQRLQGRRSVFSSTRRLVLTPWQMLRLLRRHLTTAASSTSRHDVLVVGGGPTGATTACALASHPATRHLSVALLDSQPYKVATLGDAPDPRVLALSPASVALLRSCGVWPLIEQSERTTHDPPSKT
jgi:hypothetical protein